MKLFAYITMTVASTTLTTFGLLIGYRILTDERVGIHVAGVSPACCWAGAC